MIKPQGKIRPEFINDIDDGICTSLDSYRVLKCFLEVLEAASRPQRPMTMIEH